MNEQINAELQAVRQAAGYKQAEDFSIIEVSGKDAESYLQGRCSNDLKALKTGQGQLNSLLDRKGYLIAFFTVHRLEDSYWIISFNKQTDSILKELSTYHFREQIKYEEIGRDFSCFIVQGVLASSFIASNSTQPPGEEEYSINRSSIFGIEAIAVKRSLCGDAGYLFFVRKEKGSAFKTALEAAGKTIKAIEISAEALDILRIEAGITVFGIDIDQEHLLPETGLEQQSASYNKGCFQGQEVLARIKTYGAPRRALVGLAFEEKLPEPLALNSKFSISNEDCGVIKSNCFSPGLGQNIALAYIARDYRVPEKRVLLELENGSKLTATVKFLPFYTADSSKAKAAKLYEEALKEFAHASETKAIKILREVIELDPLHTDAYESLGVILSRQEQYDEAIALMHRLQALDPNSIMAHTNLSIYYMHLGDKEKAEEEKAISMGLRMSQLAKEHAEKKKQDENKARLKEESEQRLQMFRQVLEIDPSDFLANNGVGSVYVELERYEEALPYLLKAIEVKPTHTVAYLALGKAFEHLDRKDDARRVYLAGIDIAAKRGDITPMKEMQGLLAAAENRWKVASEA
ncbi:MAG: tetratricopeptide repeat protein [Candidatus Obscuribacterales bacterium]|nr:tetratricopeptide repeat protein [Candidatus Obscuribacterales bacterium]